MMMRAMRAKMITFLYGNGTLIKEVGNMKDLFDGPLLPLSLFSLSLLLSLGCL